MKKTHNELTCLFGHHDYSDKVTEDKYGLYIYLCKICQRSGYRKHDDGFEEWSDYDEKGNCIHIEWDDGNEVWYTHDEQGNWIYEKRRSGDEYWRDNNGYWVNKKPKNWKYEKST